MSERWRPSATRAGAFWSGAWRDVSATLAVHDPEDGRLVGQVADCSPADVDEAVQIGRVYV